MTSRFERFSERARQVLSYAQEEASVFNHNYVGTEHLLLGVLRDPECRGAKVLDKLDVSRDKLRAAIMHIIRGGEPSEIATIGLTPRANKVIELAVAEAREAAKDYIGSEHLLLGLMREGEGVASGVLESLGVTLENVQEQVATLPPDAPPLQVLSRALDRFGRALGVGLELTGDSGQEGEEGVDGIPDGPYRDPAPPNASWFGMAARDRFSGFQGVITGYATYKSGKVQYEITPHGTVEVSPIWLDRNRLVLDSIEPKIVLHIPEDKKQWDRPAKFALGDTVHCTVSEFFGDVFGHVRTVDEGDTYLIVGRQLWPRANVIDMAHALLKVPCWFEEWYLEEGDGRPVPYPRQRDLPEEEREEFMAWLYKHGRGRPMVQGYAPEEQDFYWPEQHDQWKTDLEAEESDENPKSDRHNWLRRLLRL